MVKPLVELTEHIDFSEQAFSGSQECRRLFHGRGHAYEGLFHVNVDWFPPVVLIILYREVVGDELRMLAEILRAKIPECKSVQVQHRTRPHAPFELISGDSISALTVIEHGLTYAIQLGASQNVGLFLDMANGRKWVMENAKGKTVLNLFSFTCSFSVAALAGGAKQVYNVDNNSGVLRRGRENHLLNNHDMRAVRFNKIDIFKSFGRLRKHGPYNLLISDPPSFQRGSVDIKRDYGKIIRQFPRLMEPDGKIMLCLNTPDLGEDFLFDLLEKHCPQCCYIEKISAPRVFREAVKAKGLKVLVLTYQP